MNESPIAPLAFERFLYLADDPQVIEACLQPGAVLPGVSEDIRLRDDISTDEITPVAIMSHYDEKLGEFAYTGVLAGGRTPIARRAVKEAGIQVVVAGNRYGKGSSREHSPAAEKHAGVRLIFARSFERIYRQNADNIGLLTSTDFTLLAQLLAGQSITLEQILQERDELTQAIVRSGGLLNYGKRYLARSRPQAAAAGDKPQTLFEKIIARHVLRTEQTGTDLTPGTGIFLRADWRFIHEYYTGMAAHMLYQSYTAPLQLFDTEKVIAFEDHTSYIHESPAHLRQGLVPNMLRMCQAHRDFVKATGLRWHRTLTEDEARRDDGSNVAGISHAMMAEHYALPGQVVVGTDSHTPHSGALGCVAFGVGTTDMANAFMTGAVRITMPPGILVRLQGTLPAGVAAKDIVLHLLALPQIREGKGVGRVFEFTGAVIDNLSVDERATLTNMCAELGGFTGIVAPDIRTVQFLQERRGVAFELADWMRSDPGATYEQEMTVDCSTLDVLVAAPGDPGNGRPVGSLGETVAIDIAYGGSCTAGKREDFDQYHAVLAWGLQQGLHVAPHVQLYLQYGTTAVRDYCVQKGYDQVFERMGAHILQPSCGACANCGPGSSTDAGQTTISAINRNFPGRSGPGNVWLGSPATVMASALAGHICSFSQLQEQAATGQQPV
ncbi:aconitase family protein [Advenella mimigardefordensis]|uniref:3-isopropylmalate dehydratase large subunit n=1 Tax=Advenella mimigardefordensis (strain DSM 17166 / LMG 22922 / DPN7) TaxID=1247726 RepID=W0PC22_ADVMD|nr:aconitase family protein [Advenella mimigardefordensis]AHG63037.1 3-isopropylmalate dehydratase large subunit [Advenella mimigardefordensis DPN7]